MRVRMKTIMAGPRGGAHPGDLVDVADAHGEELIKRGFAEPHAPASRPAKASAPAPAALKEKAVKAGAGEKAVQE